MPTPEQLSQWEELRALAERVRREIASSLLSRSDLPRACWFSEGRAGSPVNARRRGAFLWSRVQTTDIRINWRLSRSLGRATCSKKIIDLSSMLLAPENRETAENTIRHEFAHILAPRYSMHGAAWKAWARFCGADERSAFKGTLFRPYTLTCECCSIASTADEKWLRKKLWWIGPAVIIDTMLGSRLVGLRCGRCSSSHIRLTKTKT